MLSTEDFKSVVKNAPLFAIDLVVLSQKNEILVGKRLNSPAKNWWFVPGGRVFKNESLAKAFNRISINELGVSLHIDHASLLGLYDHFYSESFFCNTISTHYINATHVVKCNVQDLALPMDSQHDNYRWVGIDNLSTDEGVHHYSKVFLNELFRGYL